MCNLCVWICICVRIYMYMWYTIWILYMKEYFMCMNIWYISYSHIFTHRNTHIYLYVYLYIEYLFHMSDMLNDSSMCDLSHTHTHTHIYIYIYIYVYAYICIRICIYIFTGARKSVLVLSGWQKKKSPLFTTFTIRNAYEGLGVKM